MQFLYYAPPVVLTMTPTCGPNYGGTKITLTGTGFLSSRYIGARRMDHVHRNFFSRVCSFFHPCLFCPLLWPLSNHMPVLQSSCLQIRHSIFLHQGALKLTRNIVMLKADLVFNCIIQPLLCSEVFMWQAVFIDTNTITCTSPPFSTDTVVSVKRSLHAFSLFFSNSKTHSCL